MIYIPMILHYVYINGIIVHLQCMSAVEDTVILTPKPANSYHMDVVLLDKTWKGLRIILGLDLLRSIIGWNNMFLTCFQTMSSIIQMYVFIDMQNTLLWPLPNSQSRSASRVHQECPNWFWHKYQYFSTVSRIIQFNVFIIMWSCCCGTCQTHNSGVLQECLNCFWYKFQ